MKKSKHSIGRDKQERCHCQFQVVWLGGPQKGKSRFVDCGDICILMPGNIEGDSSVRAFLEKVKDCKTGETVSEPDDRLDTYVTRISKKSKSSSSRPKKECHGDSTVAGSSNDEDDKTNQGSCEKVDNTTGNGPANTEATPLEQCSLPSSMVDEDGIKVGKRMRTRRNSDACQGRSEATVKVTSAKKKSPRKLSTEAELPAENCSGFTKDNGEDCTLDKDLAPCDQVAGSLRVCSPTRGNVSEIGAGKCTDVLAKPGNSDDCLGVENGSRRETLDTSSLHELHIKHSDVSIGAQCEGRVDENEGKMDQLTDLQRHHSGEASATSKVIAPFTTDREIIDLDSEEDADPMSCPMDRDDRVPRPVIQDLNGVFTEHMTSGMDVSSGLPDLNKPEANTIASSSIKDHKPNEIPSMSVSPTQTSDDRDANLVPRATRGLSVDLNHGVSNPEHCSTIHTKAGLSEDAVNKSADNSVVDRSHFKCPSGSLPEAGKFVLEDKTHQFKRKPGQSSLPLFADESGNKDFNHSCCLHKLSECCIGHVSSCSCTAFQGCCKKRNSHECCHVRFVHMGQPHAQQHICGHATSCICEGQNQCHHDDLRYLGNSTWTRCHSASSERSLGGRKRVHSQSGHDHGHDYHMMQSEHHCEVAHSKERPRVNGTSKAHEHFKEVKILTSSQVLLIENLEKDVTPSKALKIVMEVSCGAISVYIWPTLEYETVRKGYICYEDSQAADVAYSTFLGEKFLIVSSRRRPWVISRVDLDLADLKQLSSLSAAATLKEDSDSGDVENEGLSILYYGTVGYTLALAKKRLFLEQRKELRLCFKRFSKEDEELEENLEF